MIRFHYYVVGRILLLMSRILLSNSKVKIWIVAFEQQSELFFLITKTKLFRTYYYLKNDVGVPSINVNLYVNYNASIFLLQLPCTLSTACLWLCFGALTHHYFSWSLGEILFIELKRSISHIPLEHGNSSLSNLPRKKTAWQSFYSAFFTLNWRTLVKAPLEEISVSDRSRLLQPPRSLQRASALSQCTR